MKLLIIVLAMMATGAGALHSWHTRGLYVRAALLSEAFSLAAPVKLRVSDYYLKHGVLPNDNKDVDLPPPRSIYGTSVKRVAINRGGVLLVDFEDRIGVKAMTFTPAISPISGLLVWNCTSESIEPGVLQRLKPVCDAVPASKESNLMHAIANRDLVQVERLLLAGAQANAVIHGSTPLLLAAGIGDGAIAEHLLQAGASVDSDGSNMERQTPLMVAITGNHAELVALLLSHGASVTQRDYRGLTAFDHAIATDRRLGGERMVLMVSARYTPVLAASTPFSEIDLEAPVEREYALRKLYVDLDSAARDCRVKHLAELLEAEKDLTAPAQIDGRDLSEITRRPECSLVLSSFLQSRKSYQRAMAAYFADQVKRCELTEILKVMDQNSELSVLARYKGQSHLDRAVSAGCATVVQSMVRDQRLLDRLPPDILATAIRQAPQVSLVKMVGYLIEAGANVNMRDASGQSPLELAISLEQPVVAKFLIDAGADVNQRTINRSWPLVEATKKGYQHLVEQLIARGADLDARDSLGRTALLAAVGSDRYPLVDVLVHAGANTRIRDENGVDALLLAESRDRGHIRRTLLASTDRPGLPAGSTGRASIP